MAGGRQFHGSSVCSSWLLVRPETMQVCGEFGPAEFGETDAAVQQRPQHAIGEAAVVAMVVGLSQADRGKRNAAGLRDMWRERRFTVRDVPGPTES